MNNDRRKALKEAMANLDQARVYVALAKDGIEACKDNEQEYFDNMPEAFQQGDKGEAATAAVAELEEAESCLDEAIDHIEQAIN